MPISTDAIPNKPLTGAEVLMYSLALVRECAQKYFAKLFRIDFGYTMRNPAVPKHEVSISHLQEETIKCPTCDGNDTVECETCCMERRIPNTPAVALNTILAEAKSRMERDWVFGRNLAYPKIAYSFTLHFSTVGGVVAQRTISGMVENPNLVRVHYRMPFLQTEKVLPTEENPMGGLVTHETIFDAGKYPPPAAPEEKDATPDVALPVIAGESEDEGDDEGEELPLEPDEVEPGSEGEPEAPASVPAAVEETPAVEKPAKQRGRRAKAVPA